MIKKLLLFLSLILVPQLYYAEAPMPQTSSVGVGGPSPMDGGMPDEEMSYDQLREWADVLFPDFTPEMKEQTIAQTMEMDRQLKEMSPEDRAAEERKMITELNDALGMDIPLDIVDQPKAAEEVAKPKVEEVKVPTVEKSKLEKIKQTVEKLIDILESFQEKTNTLTMKDNSKLSITVAQWNDLMDEVSEAISYLRMVKGEKKLLEGLLQADQNELKDKIEDAEDNLRRPVKNIEVPDTMGLSEVVDDDGNVVYASETVAIDKVTSQRSFKTTIKYLQEFLDTYKATWALKRLIEKYAPEELKQKKAQEEKKKAQGRDPRFGGAGYGGGGYPGGSGGYGDGGYYPGEGYYPGGSGGYPGYGKDSLGGTGSAGGAKGDTSKPSGGSTRRSKKDKDEDKKKEDDKKVGQEQKDKKAPGKKKEQPDRKKIKAAALNKKIQRFKGKLSDIDTAIKEDNIEGKIGKQARSNMYDSSLHSSLKSLEEVEVPLLSKYLEGVESDLSHLSKDERDEIEHGLATAFRREKAIASIIDMSERRELGHTIRQYEDRSSVDSKEIASTLTIVKDVGSALGNIKKKLSVLPQIEPTEKEKAVASLNALDADIKAFDVNDIMKNIAAQPKKASEDTDRTSDLNALQVSSAAFEKQVQAYVSQEQTGIDKIADKANKDAAQKIWNETKELLAKEIEGKKDLKTLLELDVDMPIKKLGNPTDTTKQAVLADLQAVKALQVSINGAVNALS